MICVYGSGTRAGSDRQIPGSYWPASIAISICCGVLRDSASKNKVKKDEEDPQC